MTGKWEFTPADYANAQDLLERERISPLTEDTLFTACMYCVLSARESYNNQLRRYNQLTQSGLSTPQAILEHKTKVIEIFGKGKFNESKAIYVLALAHLWNKSDVPSRIVADASSGWGNWFELRNALADFAPGIGYKNASLVMRGAGYVQSSPMDVHTTEFISDKGYDLGLINGRRRRGYSGPEHILYESYFFEIRNYEYPSIESGFLQALVWTKRSRDGPKIGQYSLQFG